MPNSSNKKLNQESSYFLQEYQLKISINGVEFLSQNVLNIVIREGIFDLCPILELSFLDAGDFSEHYLLSDSSIISIQLGSSNLKKPIIDMDFELQDHTITNLNGDTLNLTQINLTGIIKNNNLFSPQITKSFANKSSFDVLKSIASDSGFNPVIRTSTSDVMTWRQLNQNNYQMIYETMKRAYKSNDAILTGITRNRDFIITSLMTELNNKKAKKTLYDPLQAISLSNEKSKDKTDMIYFNNFSMTNIAGLVNKEIGYGIQYSVYNFDEVKTKTINSTFHPLTKYSLKDKKNIDKISRNDGLYFHNNLNMHKNYSDALIQNEFYIKTFFDNCLILYVNPNENVNIFDLLDVTFPSFEGQGINQPMSGVYFCGLILHEASKDGFYRMKLVCFRNGYNLPVSMKDQEITLAK